MLISEFSKRTGLSKDTIRFYIRKGLLLPQMGREGGSNPYQHFSERDVSIAGMIRFAQSLGLTLKEIAQLALELQSEGLSQERELQILDEQLAKLERKSIELTHLMGYLRGKRDWVAQGKPGNDPQFTECLKCQA